MPSPGWNVGLMFYYRPCFEFGSFSPSPPLILGCKAIGRTEAANGVLIILY